MAGSADILKHMLEEHVEVFREAAMLYEAAILVRRTNTATLQHIGKDYALPKRLDCKAKTADFDVLPLGSKPSATKRGCIAGLVVDPTLFGPSAYKEGRYPKAVGEWNNFKARLRPEMDSFFQQQTLTYIPHGGLYFVELNPKDPYYGCVKFAANSLIRAGKCIHGDFDLYGIVDMKEPERLLRVREERLGMEHARSPKFFDVQHYVNNKIGVTMVLHGSQETYASEHEDDELDIFFPNGRIAFAGPTGADIAEFYQTEFPGRTLFRKDDPAIEIKRRYVSPGEF
ncbi:hypothetical protein K1718_16575 [Roseibium porphyridii]|uniref:Uncharacterized protein n=1 Tax=Roseibium porphyridii TaxID=2866279 RepID=A0ABY8EY78_9HYPH|nr:MULTISPECIES: hypothetical protein [Stappiaceae]QFT32435.1 hypothetical protein FIV00_18245 [Labrenzia sp. THAF82]WFE87771.1 hypothetical protein K1718_16575 [Roseibium sp. KMA01]